MNEIRVYLMLKHLIKKYYDYSLIEDYEQCALISESLVAFAQSLNKEANDKR